MCGGTPIIIESKLALDGKLLNIQEDIMINQLFDETRNYGEPERSKYAQEIDEMHKKLVEQLDQEGRLYLDRLETTYLQQSNAELKDVFVEGFCAAMELVWEIIDRLTHGGDLAL